jgi:hypothetical protein
MADQNFESGGEERAWDEYDWERFLQQQDRKTEKYMELLEKYLDDPNRDQIIAREMGWHHLLDENGKDWSEDLDDLFARQHAETNGGRVSAAKAAEDEDEDAFDKDEDEDNFDDDLDDEDLDEDEEPGDEEEEDELEDRYGQHPLYQAASALNVYIDQLFDEQDPAAQHPAVARLTTSCTLANVKLAAALSDDDVDELGMTIAYLKRALKAITNALDAATLCRQEQLFDHEQTQDLRMRIFHVRDGIVSLMGYYRNEWRKRHGHGC